MKSRLSLALLLALLFGACGGEEVEQPFDLASTPAEQLVATGMEKVLDGDTVLTAFPTERVVSYDSTKVAWCDGRMLYVQDVDGGEAHVLHEETDDSAVVACFDPSWGRAGDELQFKEARRVDANDSTFSVVSVVITLGRSEDQ